MSNSREKPEQFRLTYRKKEDSDIDEFLKAQIKNKGLSIQTLMRDYINKHGFTDVLGNISIGAGGKNHEFDKE